MDTAHDKIVEYFCRIVNPGSRSNLGSNHIARLQSRDIGDNNDEAQQCIRDSYAGVCR
jgi:hypothetical protein